jgi:transposase
MVDQTDVRDVCCAALELSQTSWVLAFSAPSGGKVSTHKIKANDVDRLIRLLEGQQAKAEQETSRSLTTMLCYEVGYDGFWLARLLNERGWRTVVFDPASFLVPRRGRLVKTDRLDAEGMVRTLRAWLGGDARVVREVCIPTVEEEDAKRIERERKHLVQQRTRVVGRIKGLLALHGIRLASKGIGKSLQANLTNLQTGDGRHLGPFLMRDVARMLRHLEFINEQIAEVESDRGQALATTSNSFPCRDKVKMLTKLDGIGETTATTLVAEVYHRTFPTRRHVAAYMGLAPSQYASGAVSRDRGISKAGSKLARTTVVELAWFWLRYQPASKLARWWHERFADKGMRGRKVGIVALARKLAIALWRFLEHGVVPEGATMKA